MVLLERVNCPGIVAGKMEMDVLPEASMASAEDEAVAVEPVGVLGVVAHLIPPEGDADGGGAHDGAGVTTLELNAS